MLSKLAFFLWDFQYPPKPSHTAYAKPFHPCIQFGVISNSFGVLGGPIQWCLLLIPGSGLRVLSWQRSCDYNSYWGCNLGLAVCKNKHPIHCAISVALTPLLGFHPTHQFHSEYDPHLFPPLTLKSRLSPFLNWALL